MFALFIVSTGYQTGISNRVSTARRPVNTREIN